MEIIKSKDNKKIKYLKSLLQKKNRNKHQQYLIEGEHLCQMAKEAGVLQEIISTPKASFAFDKKTFVDPTIIKLLSSSVTPQPIVGLVSIQENKLVPNKNYIILDNIQEPGNLGAILRSALAFGYENIVLSQNTVDLFNGKTLRSAQGANFKLNIIKTNLETFIPTLNFPTIATILSDKSHKLKDYSIKNQQHAIVVGNEGSGIRPNIIALCTENIYIEIENIDSLNVVVATAIVAYKIKNF